jgi:LacI family transcriptional regulator
MGQRDSTDKTTGAPATLDDVARETGVHPSTVSRALDPARQTLVKESTRVRIVEAADRLGYRPHMIARGLQSGRTATVGVIAADLGNTWVAPIIHGIAAAIEPSGMLPIIAETQDDDGRFRTVLDHLLSRRVDAIIVLAGKAGFADQLVAANRVVPIVIAARPLEGSGLPTVIQDDRLGGKLAAEHLASLGHRSAIQLRGPGRVENFPLRAAGFSSGCLQRGVGELTTGMEAERPVVDEGRRLMAAFLDSGVPRPTAIFAHNDLMALGALAALRSASIDVPGDVSLVGYNDLPMVGHLTPPLTTVRYPSHEVGRTAGEMVLERLAGHTVSDVCLEPTLIARQSTRSI